ncbi:MAG TPA: hypothetical protein VK638_46975 [Edaphobacter sp.]|nr:hypothetical protein [Edaphobacter sp.]
MSTIAQFIHPLKVRWQERNLCSDCGAQATLKCKTHGSKICRDADCRMAHRRAKGAVYGDLTRPFCEYKAMNTALDHCIHAAAVFVTAVGFIWFFALMGVL